jgi:hypothetical protein
MRMSMADEVKALKAYVPLSLKKRAFVKFIEREISYSEWTRRALESWLADLGEQDEQAVSTAEVGQK